MKRFITTYKISLIAGVISLLPLLACFLFPTTPSPVSVSITPASQTTQLAAATESKPAVIQAATTTASPSQPVTPAPSTPVQTQAPAPVLRCQDTATSPNTVVIEDICLSTSMQRVGLTANGEIDTPVSNVGLWGVEPGQIGNSLLDGHVFGVFSGLSRIDVGSTISVNNGTIHTYRVTGTETVALEDLYKNGKWDSILFPYDSQSHLTLITCAGHSLGGGQYSHRFFVYAILES